MLRFNIIFIFIFFGCASSSKTIFDFFPQKSYPEYLDEYKSCTGKGIIKSKGSLSGKLSFNFKSQGDSTFLDFSDPIGRKTLLVWVTKHSIIARNLIENRQYENDEVMELLPVLRALEPNDLTKIIWGVKPEKKKKSNKKELFNDKDFVMNFYRGNLDNEKRALAGIYFEDNSIDSSIKIDIKTRNRNLDFVDMKKVWRLLKY